MIVLSKHNPEHIDEMVGWLNDPEIVRYSEQRHKRHTHQTQREYITTHPGVFLEIHNDEHFIGTISAYIDSNNMVADVGILIGCKFIWGKGCGTQAWFLFCDLLLKSNVRKIEAGHMASNHGMSRICEK